MPNFYFYLLFIVIIIMSISIDVFTQKENMSIKNAINQFVLWVIMAAIFVVILGIYKNKETTLKFVSGYIVELSLSIDNVFVFILIFQQYKIEKKYINKLLLIGVLLAVILRVIFITLGVGLISQFAWVLYLFGPILVWTGIKVMAKKEEVEQELKESKFIIFIKKIVRYSPKEHHGKYFLSINKKTFISTLALTAIILAGTDILFALDSIPTIISLVKNHPNIPFNENEILVIYSSNIFAILGLRSLFFIVKNMSNKFEYLQKSIGVILIFIGIKMLIGIFHIHISVSVSLAFIIASLLVGIITSQIKKSKSN